MADDWQDLALNHRRIPHGKSKKGGKAAGRHGAGVFNPSRAITRYECKTHDSAIGNGHLPRFLNAFQSRDDFRAEFVIHGFTDIPGGYVASIVNSSGTFKAAAFLAGSRKLLREIVSDEEAKSSGQGALDGAAEAADEDEGVDDDDNDDDEETVDSADEYEQAPEESALEASDRFQNERVQAFAKNTFRQAKFWLQWQGEIVKSESTGGAPAMASNAVRERNLGYVIFPTNECLSFHGTINCKTLGWKDLEIFGGRDRIQGSTTPRFAWNEFSVDVEDVDAGGEAGDDERHIGQGGTPHLGQGGTFERWTS